jgi:hypothetical protein
MKDIAPASVRCAETASQIAKQAAGRDEKTNIP